MRIVLFILFCAFLAIASCKKNENNTSSTGQSILKADSTTLTLGGGLNSQDSFSVQSNGAWTIAITPTTATWLKTSVASGSGNKKVGITVQEKNNTSSVRTAEIVITSNDNPSTSVTISINQSIEKSWQAIAIFPGVGRTEATSFVIGDNLYVGVGNGIKNNSQQDISDFYEYSSSNNTWSQKNDFPGGPREFSLGFSINGKGYLAFGQHVICTPLCGGTTFKDIWEYDPSTDGWQKDTTYDFLDENASVLSCVFVVGEKAYFLLQEKLWEFNPATLSVTEKANCPEALSYATAFSINGKGYVGTGYTNPLSSSSFYEYDVSLDRWTKKADFPGEKRYGAIGFSVNGKGYIGCGEGPIEISPGLFQTKDFNDFWEYNVENNTWNSIADYPGLNSYFLVNGVIGNKAIVGAGNSYERPTIDLLKDFWSY